MNLRHAFAIAAVLLSSVGLVRAAELAGHWTAEFDSPIGPQKYTYDFTVAGDKITGKATYEHSMGKGENELSAIKVNGDEVSFAETLKINGSEVPVTYTGTIAGDEMKLSRQVGDFGTETLVAKRASGSGAKPAPETEKPAAPEPPAATK
jgi:hypothetical protein